MTDIPMLAATGPEGLRDFPEPRLGPGDFPEPRFRDGPTTDVPSPVPKFAVLSC